MFFQDNPNFGISSVEGFGEQSPNLLDHKESQRLLDIYVSIDIIDIILYNVLHSKIVRQT